jgi:hypothetical protein
MGRGGGCERKWEDRGGGEGGEKGEVFMKSIPPNDVQEEASSQKVNSEALPT